MAVQVRVFFDSAWIFVAAVCLAVVGSACGAALTSKPEVDFYSFWNSSRLILEGSIAAVYAFQPSVLGELMPLAYPPPFLIAIFWLAALPFGLSFCLWVAVTGLLYVFASQGPRRVALGNPSAALNGFVGQNGFLTSAVMLLGMHVLTRRPVLGGAILGLMVMKPQLALLLPIAVVAGRLWAAIPAAIASASALLALALLCFGWEAYRGFLDVLPTYQALLVSGRWPWERLASVFAFVRWFGASELLAWAMHAVVAMSSSVLVWRAWRHDWDAKIPILAAGSLLMSPYVFAYDAVLLVAPLAWLSQRRPAFALGVAALSALPLAQAWGFFQGPSTTSLAAITSLVGIAWLCASAARTERPEGRYAPAPVQ